MESLPKQRIEALPGATRRETYFKVEALCALRRLRTYSEDEIAKKAGFGGVEAMYHNLKTWGLTGLLPPEKQEEAPKPKGVDEEPSLKARSSSQPEVLPDAKAAAELFNEALEGLARVVENLEDLDLSYQRKRFVGTYRLAGRWTFLRKSSSEQGWKEICEEYGQDPDVNSFSVDGLSGWDSLGVSHYPPRDLVVLIAAYALSDRPIELLLEVLAPGYSQETLEEVRDLFYRTKRQDGSDGLRRTAEQFAAAVYDRKVGKGFRPEESPKKHRLACHITARREAGVPDELIFQDIRDKGYDLSKEEFERLAALGLKFPGT